MSSFQNIPQSTIQRAEDIRAKLIHWLIILAFFLAGLSVFAVYPSTFGDMNTYLAMARNPFEFAGVTFGYRIGQPLLVHYISQIFHSETDRTYAIITYIQCACIGMLLSHWLQIKGVAPSLSLGLVAVYYFSLPGAFDVAAWGLVDAPFHLFLLLGLLAIDRGHDLRLAAILFVGCFFKENLLLLLPYFIVHETGRSTWYRVMLRFSAISIAGLSSFWLVRSGWIFDKPPDPRYALSQYNREYFEHVIEYWGGVKSVVSKIYSVYMNLWFFALGSAILFLRRSIPDLALVTLSLAQIPFATDIERMVAPAFPAIYSLVARYLSGRSRIEQVFAIVSPMSLYLVFQYALFYRELVIFLSLVSIIIVFRRLQVVYTSGAFDKVDN
jgi:hypothetical protein